MSQHLWALVLAAGEGRRIRHLTTDAAGRSVPKQYASLDGEVSIEWILAPLGLQNLQEGGASRGRYLETAQS
jgi:CTP:molybdopterin cytidylyltransferase MocA